MISTTPPHCALRVIPAEAEIGHQLAELLQSPYIFGMVLLGKLHDQHGIRIAADRNADDRLKHRDLPAQRQHGAIDQFHCDGAKLHQMLGGIHRLVEAAEMTDAQHLVADHRPQLQFDLGGEGERPLRSHQQMRHVVGGIARHQRIEVVAADAALHFREFRGDLGRFAFAESQHVGKQIEAVVARVQPRGIARHLAEMKHRAVGEGSVHRQRVVAHGAVAQRAAAAGIVAGHAADGGARRGGDIDREPQAMFSELPVEVVQDDSRLDHTASIFDVERDDAVQVFREIDDDAVIDGLAALRRAAAARRDDPAVVPGDAERPQRFVDGARHHHDRPA